MTGPPPDPNRQRHAIAAYPVWVGSVYYEPTTDDEHARLGWQRATAEGRRDTLMLSVHGDGSIELWHHPDEGDSVLLHRWQP